MTFELVPWFQAGGLAVDVKGNWSEGAREAIVSGRADGVVLNYARGFVEQPLDFLQGLPIRRLSVLARSVSDLSPVYSLASTLEEFSVDSDPRATLDLGRLPRLTTLAADWPQVRESIARAPQLDVLTVARYSEHDLGALASLPSLKSLVLMERPKLQSLDGVEAFPHLKHLGVFFASRLANIDALAHADRSALKTLQLQACKKVTDISAIANCTNLTFLDISEGGTLETLAPLAHLTDLEELYLYDTTRVADGDLSPLRGLTKLRDFRMMNRRGYHPAAQEIQGAIT